MAAAALVMMHVLNAAIKTHDMLFIYKGKAMIIEESK